MNEQTSYSLFITDRNKEFLEKEAGDIDLNDLIIESLKEYFAKRGKVFNQHLSILINENHQLLSDDNESMYALTFLIHKNLLNHLIDLKITSGLDSVSETLINCIKLNTSDLFDDKWTNHLWDTSNLKVLDNEEINELRALKEKFKDIKKEVDKLLNG